VVRTPVRAPEANAYAERWVRTIRAECLDWLLIRNRRQLEHVLTVHVEHYNTARPHRSLDRQTPQPASPPPARASSIGQIERVDCISLNGRLAQATAPIGRTCTFTVQRRRFHRAISGALGELAHSDVGDAHQS
jgi:hypothetical protein